MLSSCFDFVHIHCVGKFLCGTFGGTFITPNKHIVFGFIGIGYIIINGRNGHEHDLALGGFGRRVANVGLFAVGYVLDFDVDGRFLVITLVGVCWFYPCCGYSCPPLELN